ncbi:MAG: hypothetical protein DI586_06800 [Micavibrio aeruginosavorus]|uniref:Prepilin-type N-terminal cleavage/methylation domain-containing protein n=1 Tax=Micavibrio aeruginosavorus TaxID=349221 RepID=A0A2W5FNM9_9BACT|nr:MAG: hypothetical protein DI586_06800 [Micavibrio aeruginosavorus]
MAMKSESKRKGGFTLVELSIVMIIIGLLIGGILKGAELIENSRLNTVIATTKQITSAYNTFWDSYRGKPGDLAYARTMIPGCNDQSSCVNGNGNQKVGAEVGNPWSDIVSTIGSENTQFWKHLALADLIGGVNPSASEVGWGKTHIESPIAGGFQITTTRGSGGYASVAGLTILTRSRDDGQWLCGVATGNFEECSLSPNQAFRIDNKLDDGHAQSGKIAAISMSFRNGCGTPNTGINGPKGYNEGNSVKSCDMFFWLAP